MRVLVDSDSKQQIKQDLTDKPKSDPQEDKSTMAGKGDTTKGKGKISTTGKVKEKRCSKSSRAGIQFPVSRVGRNMKQRVSAKCRIADLASVYLASVLEYLTAEVIELAGNAAKDAKVKRIIPRHIVLAIRGDEELDALVHATIASGGVVPHIHKSLIPRPKQ